MKVRWRMFGFMFGFVLLAYMQRNSVAVAADTVMPLLHLTVWQIGLLNAVFTGVYALTQFPGGMLGRRIGARRTFVSVGIVGFIATAMLPISPLVLSGSALFIALLGAQALLGLSQGPIFPVSASIMEAWFPKNRWAMALGLQTSGALLGGALLPLFVVGLTRVWGWQVTLLAIAVPVAVLTILWARSGRNYPSEHPGVTRRELDELAGNPSHNGEPVALHRAVDIISNRNVLLLSTSYLLMNYTFYFLCSWSFFYLVKIRHFKGIESGFVGMVPWIGATVGCAAGGISDWVVDRIGPRWGMRMIPLITLPSVAALMCVTLYAKTPYESVLALTLTFAAVEINEGVYWAATMRIAPDDVGVATGFLNMGGNLGGVLCQLTVAALVSIDAWGAALGTGSVLALVAAVLWLFVDAGQEVHAAAAFAEPAVATGLDS